ncbi:hypothetical protein G9A89_005847 [Geosiphon pyriformis]|nr:hypothetical protein G9A89_005847 [Geosiphon pyriformis]
MSIAQEIIAHHSEIEPTPTNKSTVTELEIQSAFNFYVNEKIVYLLETLVNTESAKETFYHKLIQNTSLPTNYNFTFIITEINKEIKHYTQQRYPITYANKDKEKLQTPAKTRVKSPTNPLYHYTPGSAINITSTGASTLIFGQFPFQNFGTASPWEVMKLEKKQEEEEEESKDQEFTYQNPIPENLNIKTPNFQTQQNPNLENPEIGTPNFQMQHNQNNQNSDINNQQHLPPIIRINPLLQPPQQPQQLLQQLQQQLQQPNVNPMAYALIAKLEKFTGKENNAQVWLNDVEKAITLAFLQYFSNNNSINRLVNTFTTIKQGENEAVTTYLGHFHRNLCQIQAIQTDYFTVPQILNQFIRGLCSSILQHVCSMHLIDLQATVNNAKDFEAAELKVNHAQAVNLVMNKSSELDSKLKQFSDSINQKLEEYLADNRAIYQPFQ